MIMLYYKYNSREKVRYRYYQLLHSNKSNYLGGFSMSFYDEVKNFSTRIVSLKDSIQTEEATKMSIIVPFFQMLGYDVFNPAEFCPEYTADVGIKKGEKVDYAILLNGKPIILIEAKNIHKKLDKHSSQLFRYYVTTPAKFAILTNGIQYKFYTDLDEPNKMDKEPFLDINLLNPKENEIIQLEGFCKDKLDMDGILDTASLLKYSNAFRNQIASQFQAPSDEFVKLFLQPIYKGAKTQIIIEKYRPILKKALNDFLNDSANEKMQFVLGTSNNEEFSNSDRDWNLLTTLKEILKDTLNTDELFLKCTKSYTAIYYNNNISKWICRVYTSSTQTTLALPDEQKKEERHPIIDFENIFEYSESICNVAKRYLTQPTSITSKNVLHTKWGNYVMPEQYSIDLSYGPRDYLKKL